MKQLGLDLTPPTRNARKREFLDETGCAGADRAAALPRAKAGRPPFIVETMRYPLPSVVVELSDHAREEALRDMSVFRESAELLESAARLPDETTILRFRCLLDNCDLAMEMTRVVDDLQQAKGRRARSDRASPSSGCAGCSMAHRAA